MVKELPRPHPRHGYNVYREIRMIKADLKVAKRELEALKRKMMQGYFLAPSEIQRYYYLIQYIQRNEQLLKNISMFKRIRGRYPANIELMRMVRRCKL